MQKILCLLTLISITASLWAGNYAGLYSSANPDEPLTLTLEQVNESEYRGMLRIEGIEEEGMAVRGRDTGEHLVGKINDFGDWIAFEARLGRDGSLFLTDEDGETLEFRRGKQTHHPQSVQDSSSTPSPSSNAVVVNGQNVAAPQLTILSQKYGLSIQSGRYWYDKNSGAWGLEGGPTVGFIQANLDLPGPMPANISQGGTGIFINGREIHPMDQMGLQQLFGVTYQGRYWLDAYGNLGLEGGPAIVNLLLAISQAQQKQTGGGGGSVTHGYGAAGGARGTAAGGMYSGRTATGKSVFWYPGM